MCKVYSVTSQKGGTAKTTTVFNFGAYLAGKGYRVLLIDTDPQGRTYRDVTVANEPIITSPLMIDERCAGIILTGRAEPPVFGAILIIKSL